MKYNKLVRNRIPKIIKSRGKSYSFYVASDEEYFKKLKEKLRKESDKLCIGGNKNEELTNVLKVIYAICAYKKIDRYKLDLLRKDKADKRRTFKNKIILEEN